MPRKRETEESIKAEIDLNRHQQTFARKYKQHCDRRFVELHDVYWAAHNNHVSAFCKVRHLESDERKLMSRLRKLRELNAA